MLGGVSVLNFLLFVASDARFSKLVTLEGGVGGNNLFRGMNGSCLGLNSSWTTTLGSSNGGRVTSL